MPFIKSLPITVIVTVLLMLAAGVQGAFCEPLEAAHARLNMSYESLQLPENERLGLMGGSLLFDRCGRFSMGPGFYGALKGERGGFITLGLAAETRLSFTDSLALNAGAFIGAGGGRGGQTLTGGGLMIRTHLGVQADAGPWGRIGGGLSYVDFPEGRIHSLQPYISYQYPIRFWLAEGWLSREQKRMSTTGVPQDTQEMALVYRRFLVPSGVRTSDGRLQHPKVDLVGVEWQWYLDHGLFLKVETEGAAGGENSGYMQILLGGGYRLGLTDSTAVKISASVGPAGGGSVDSGGGLTADVAFGLQRDIGKRLYLEAAAGYFEALEADFRATSLALKVGCRIDMPDTSQGSIPLAALAAFSPEHMRWRITHQTYFRADPRWRANFTDSNIDLLGFQGDYFVGEAVYLTGQALAAYHGHAGAYMIGLVGAGAQRPLRNTPLFLEAEVLTGAAGGGGVDVGGGLVWQVNGGVGYRIGKCYSLIASYGRAAAPEADFEAHVLSLSLAHRLTLFTR